VLWWHVASAGTMTPTPCGLWPSLLAVPEDPGTVTPTMCGPSLLVVQEHATVTPTPHIARLLAMPEHAVVTPILHVPSMLAVQALVALAVAVVAPPHRRGPRHAAAG
jgi:hypothetical protein